MYDRQALWSHPGDEDQDMYNFENLSWCDEDEDIKLKPQLFSDYLMHWGNQASVTPNVLRTLSGSNPERTVQDSLTVDSLGKKKKSMPENEDDNAIRTRSSQQITSQIWLLNHSANWWMFECKIDESNCFPIMRLPDALKLSLSQIKIISAILVYR